MGLEGANKTRVGIDVGYNVGEADGCNMGDTVGEREGIEGKAAGLIVGVAVGCKVGDGVGEREGIAVG